MRERPTEKPRPWDQIHAYETNIRRHLRYEMDMLVPLFPKRITRKLRDAFLSGSITIPVECEGGTHHIKLLPDGRIISDHPTKDVRALLALDILGEELPPCLSFRKRLVDILTKIPAVLHEVAGDKIPEPLLLAAALREERRYARYVSPGTGLREQALSSWCKKIAKAVWVPPMPFSYIEVRPSPDLTHVSPGSYMSATRGTSMYPDWRSSIGMTVDAYSRSQGRFYPVECRGPRLRGLTIDLGIDAVARYRSGRLFVKDPALGKDLLVLAELNPDQCIILYPHPKPTNISQIVRRAMITSGEVTAYLTPLFAVEVHPRVRYVDFDDISQQVPPICRYIQPDKMRNKLVSRITEIFRVPEDMATEMIDDGEVLTPP